ncbi:MAG TPA: TetR/AcrR family transcriptional regulator [Nitrolancea sp.]|nr:TetR/AcrR family transcriptional regulator [Nitrolancea sp.]
MATTTNTREQVETARAIAKRRQILEAARTLFLKQGFEGTSMDAITAAARVSKRTLYKYYASKEELLGDMVHQMSVGRVDRSPLRIQQMTIENRDDLENVLFGIASAMVAGHRDTDYQQLLRIIIAEGERIPALREQFVDAVVQPGEAYLSSIIERARQQGVVKIDDTDAVLRLFIGGITMSTYKNVFFSREPHWLTPEDLRTHVRLLVAAIS